MNLDNAFVDRLSKAMREYDKLPPEDRREAGERLDALVEPLSERQIEQAAKVAARRL